METSPFRIEDDDIILRLRVTPGARKPGFDGLGADAEGRPLARLRVRARAQDGAANQDVIRAVADACDRPVSRIAIDSGQSARLKTIRISGDASRVALRLKELFA